jgi:Flp pilus assembly protein TadG
MSIFHWRKGQGSPVSALTRVANRIPAETIRVSRAVARNERGATAIFFALAIVPLLAFVGLAVDTTRGYLVKSRLNQALDAAVLAGGRVYASPTRDADIRMYFKANFPDGYMGAVATPIVITPDDVNKTLTVSAQATLPTTFMHLVDIDTIPVGSSAQVTIAAQNVEVALVLDITGSMAQSGAITDLKAAANDLIDIVVQDQQTPFYTKAAIVPFSQAVNVGPYAAQVRGAILAGKNIINITKSSTATVTSTAHGFNTNDKVVIEGVGSMVEANNSLTAAATPTTSPPNLWVVQKIDADHFSLKKCGNASCSSTSTVVSSGWHNYTANTGFVYCTNPGCQFQAFLNPSGAWKTYQVTSCVTERVGANAYTDIAPNVAPVGRNYPDPANPCVTNQIVPLSNVKATLHAQINALSATGSTAGQIGAAWGWYMLSPNFAYLWPAISKPAAYGTPKLLKVMIFMTDGDFNTNYYNGVIAQDAGSGSGATTVHINHNSSNGDAFAQAKALCAGMKAPDKNIEIYTVGLGLSGSAAAVDFLNQCATSAAHIYMPNTGTDLKTAFHDIAMKISRLRLSK